MYYKLTFNHDLIDESIDNRTYPIYAQVSNLKEIEYPGIKQGFLEIFFLKQMVEGLLIGQL